MTTEKVFNLHKYLTPNQIDWIVWEIGARACKAYQIANNIRLSPHQKFPPEISILEPSSRRPKDPPKIPISEQSSRWQKYPPEISILNYDNASTIDL